MAFLECVGRFLSVQARLKVVKSFFNEITWNPPNVPSILSELSMGQDALVPSVYGPATYVLPHNAMIARRFLRSAKGETLKWIAQELRIFNEDAGFHPFHLHGHRFAIVQKNENVTSDDPVLNPDLVEEQANPMRRECVASP